MGKLSCNATRLDICPTCEGSGIAAVDPESPKPAPVPDAPSIARKLRERADQYQARMPGASDSPTVSNFLLGQAAGLREAAKILEREVKSYE